MNAGKFSRRRKILLGFVAILLAGAAYLHFTGAAGTSGIPSEEMDWDGDGAVTEQEIMQAFYAVVVEKTSEGNRECRAYAWRADKKPIRLDCKTTFQNEGSPE
ncbi:MAG TPA: EF-hand domain-containing protein [Pseudoxanthomonas sp.]|nr:EF-hand domain-containing protein [Pseudoxanthomonas sp.]